MEATTMESPSPCLCLRSHPTHTTTTTTTTVTTSNRCNGPSRSNNNNHKQMRRPRRPASSISPPINSFSHLALLLLFLLLLSHTCITTVDAVRLSGGSALALAGKNCVVLAMDQRVGTSGQLLLGGDLEGDDEDRGAGGKRESGSQRVLKVNGRVLLGMVGYDSMATAFFELLRAELNMRSMRLQHHSLGEAPTAISPKALSLLVSHLLYYRFKGAGTAPIVAGLDEHDTPVLCTQDSLGAYSFQDNFVALGSSSKALLGACEALYRPNLEGDDLVQLACQCLRAGLERDCVSGYGLVAYLITTRGVATTRLQGRMD